MQLPVGYLPTGILAGTNNTQSVAAHNKLQQLLKPPDSASNIADNNNTINTGTSTNSNSRNNGINTNNINKNGNNSDTSTSGGSNNNRDNSINNNNLENNNTNHFTSKDGRTNSTSSKRKLGGAGIVSAVHIKLEEEDEEETSECVNEDCTGKASEKNHFLCRLCYKKQLEMDWRNVSNKKRNATRQVQIFTLIFS